MTMKLSASFTRVNTPHLSQTRYSTKHCSSFALSFDVFTVDVIRLYRARHFADGRAQRFVVFGRWSRFLCLRISDARGKSYDSTCVLSINLIQFVRIGETGFQSFLSTIFWTFGREACMHWLTDVLDGCTPLRLRHCRLHKRVNYRLLIELQFEQ